MTSKRIAFLADGANPHTLKWVRSLSDKGFRILLLSLNYTDPELYSAYKNVSVVSFKVKDNLKGSGVGSFGKISYLKHLFHIRESIVAFRPSVLHAHFASSYGLIAALTFFKPFYLSVWGADVYDFPAKSFLHKLLIRFVLARADRLFSTSFVMAKETQKYTAKELEVIPFGVDLAKFNPDLNLKRLYDENQLVIGTVKTLDDKYGLKYLIMAFGDVKARFPHLNLRLLIVGRGRKESELKSLAEKIGVSDITNFTGWIPVEEIPRYHHSLDIAVFPSILDSESFGVAVVEASACGKPVIVSDRGGLPEVVKDGETGIVFKSENVSSLAAALEKLIMNPELRTMMGKNGIKRVKDNYDWNQNLEQMIQVYNSL